MSRAVRNRIEARWWTVVPGTGHWEMMPVPAADYILVPRWIVSLSVMVDHWLLLEEVGIDQIDMLRRELGFPEAPTAGSHYPVPLNFGQDRDWAPLGHTAGFRIESPDDALERKPEPVYLAWVRGK